MAAAFSAFLELCQAAWPCRRTAALARFNRGACNSVRSLDRCMVGGGQECARFQNGPCLALDLGPALVCVDSVARSHYLDAGSACDRCRCASEATFILRGVADGSRQHSTSRRGPVA